MAGLLSPAEEELRRQQAISWIARRTEGNAGAIHYSELDSVVLPAGSIPPKNRYKGIWKPAAFQSALSITTTCVPAGRQRPYEDSEGPDSLLRYKWRGDDPDQSDNKALRKAMHEEAPLIWFIGVDQGWFTAIALSGWLTGSGRVGSSW